MSAKYKATVTSEIELYPSDIAAAFWELNADEQAGFFNNLAALSGAGSKLALQLQFVTDSRCLNAFGRQAMATIGNYAERGEGEGERG